MKGKKSSIRKYQPKSTGVPLQWSTFQKQSSSAKLSEADTIFGKSQIIHRKSWSQIEHLWFFNALFIALNFLFFFFLLPLSGNKTYIYICIYIYMYIYVYIFIYIYICDDVASVSKESSTNIYFEHLHSLKPPNKISPRHSFGNMCFFLLHKKTLQRPPHGLAMIGNLHFWVLQSWVAILDCWWKTHPTLPKTNKHIPLKSGGFFKFRISRFFRGYVC